MGALVLPSTTQAESFSTSAPEAACVSQADTPKRCFQSHLSIRSSKLEVWAKTSAGTLKLSPSLALPQELHA